MNDSYPDKRDKPFGFTASLGSAEIVRGINFVLERFPNPQITEKLITAQTGIDLGSSFGNSALALYLICPNLSELHTVDDSKKISSKIRAGLPNLIEHTQTIGKFLKEYTGTADVVMLASVPDHRLNLADGYSNLAMSDYFNDQSGKLPGFGGKFWIRN